MSHQKLNNARSKKQNSELLSNRYSGLWTGASIQMNAQPGVCQCPNNSKTVPLAPTCKVAPCYVYRSMNIERWHILITMLHDHSLIGHFLLSKPKSFKLKAFVRIVQTALKTSGHTRILTLGWTNQNSELSMFGLSQADCINLTWAQMTQVDSIRSELSVTMIGLGKCYTLVSTQHMWAQTETRLLHAHVSKQKKRTKRRLHTTVSFAKKFLTPKGSENWLR